MLDRLLPYGEVYGAVDGYPTARYCQNNKFFDAAGFEVCAVAEEAQSADYENLHWKQVRKLVVDRGGEWTNKVDGIAYLRDTDDTL